MRGEHAATTADTARSRGSSPHVRGAPGVALRGRGHDGIIPACAGSTAVRRLGGDGREDHPRMRGEHTVLLRISEAASGSSPHARGALSSRPERYPSDRIIPACAGSTASTAAGACRPRDHPRMRGEHRPRKSPGPPRLGSSPHARGARNAERHLGIVVGIIPACAGSTRVRRLRRRPRRDHPRMRGEHGTATGAGLQAAGSSPHARGARRGRGGALGHGGSSPHARGAHPARHARPHGQGIIPACAGSTSGISASSPTTAGSSPHARGARGSAGEELPDHRIIPACAGSTTWASSPTTASQDHPRMRGEHAGQG